MSKFNQNEYFKEYKKRLKTYEIAINTQTDKSMIEWLESNKPVATYIKNLIEEDMKRVR